ncbi:YeiH family protein [Chitinophaga flava]|uniref:Putative sulfate exporter family transporter n=1 Tax=Chitinophaga flava TaxID=2259036 RepID=A0A365Y113_9BACT|nr:putative sulfate exporter family transporter [Chitinophaga flava]RBL92306.1 putative sulfate exporter family transporter [Chitinophaga flava]
MQLQKTEQARIQHYLPKVIFLTAAAATLLPAVEPPVALLLGLAIAQTIGNPFAGITPKITHWLLQLSVIGLGFGMNAHMALKAGKEGFLFTIASITGTLLFGALLGKLLKIEPKTSHLISCGTAICGGSAIAAISPVIKAGEKQISVALGIVFLLNSLALFVFPAVGHWLHLTQQQFGLWSAVAIHDTSSVVGAANKYGDLALQVATTVKLSRALWIMPVAFITMLLFRNGNGKIKIPWFIGLFLLAMLLNTWVPEVSTVAPYLVHSAKTALSLTLFLIGTGLTRQAFSGIGWQPLLQGILLWVLISTGALLAVFYLV